MRSINDALLPRNARKEKNQIQQEEYHHYYAPKTRNQQKQTRNLNPRKPPRCSLRALDSIPPNPTRLQRPAHDAKRYQRRETQHENHAERRPELAQGVLGVFEGDAEVGHH